ncbi:NAD(P)/FAD-dependent oxidoreductase [Achromobacter denitrificans]|uniref:NAD(P)/FAD-dependent oxidoreductase n=1 Tax=Achromobacter denitrificans TaxID=32002 RepID=UPI000788133D|nr:FAD-binding oxidoreductase [Achromobacter denitrificans]OLU09344.1 D-amino-acid oxidase [Achromobacter denitrificans]QKH41630.1 FAD-binding oxidoreductase [Achromobacter denitrificans]QKH51227.1 FAD-binding oxidoreductase [Achromobacter denitrificans]
MTRSSLPSALPPAVDVAIIGAGIIGVSAAYALAQAGVRVAVFEKGAVACEQSSRNWGWVRTLGRELPEVPLALRANQLWGQIQDRIDVGFRRSGILYLQESDADAAGHQAWIDGARAYGIDARLLGSGEARGLLPQTARNWTGAMYSANDGVAEPQLAAPAIAALARAAGAQILEGCAVRGVELAAGRISAVVTERGRVAAQAVLVAAGAWSRLFCGNLGADFPQLKVRGSVLRTTPVEGGPAAAVNGRDFTCRKRADGGYTVSQFGASMADVVPDSFRLMRHFLRSWLANRDFVRLRFGKRFFEELGMPRHFPADRASPFERHRVLDPRPSELGIEQAWRRLTHAFPVFAQASILQSWAGYIDVTPDAMPVMDAVPRLPGLYLASGFSGHGFGIGPAAGEAMAQLIQGRTPAIDLHPFRYGRYGS